MKKQKLVVPYWHIHIGQTLQSIKITASQTRVDSSPQTTEVLVALTVSNSERQKGALLQGRVRECTRYGNHGIHPHNSVA